MLIKGPNIYLSVSPFLPLLFFALDSFTHPLTCRNSTALYCSVPKVLRLLSGYFHLFHHPGFRHYFRFGCPKTTYTTDYYTFERLDSFLCFPLPFHHSNIFHYWFGSRILEGVQDVSMISLKSLGSFLMPLTGPSINPFLSHVRSDLGESLGSILLIRRWRKNSSNEIGMVNDWMINWDWSSRRGLGWYEKVSYLFHLPSLSWSSSLVFYSKLILEPTVKLAFLASPFSLCEAQI